MIQTTLCTALMIERTRTYAVCSSHDREDTTCSSHARELFEMLNKRRWVNEYFLTIYDS
jgi:hypothetical protein